MCSYNHTASDGRTPPIDRYNHTFVTVIYRCPKQLIKDNFII